ncbi:SHOCT domain-containing protein [Gottfriedia acidiceleris]|uniref:SHOCT domain-containing protein n=1 Tax=Gottfriedia acidiceleris TaxID=371036 RepID=A0ABY4JIA5_9BACI|nr:SHOCT domain-containing protein [Gottfriedia acidiceleris]UPM53565.1 SHOCT domain-containing protein [Gottfriedia acidiceleris]
MRKIRVKPSKGQSFLGLLIGIIFIVLGFTIVIPQVGLFGLLWTGIAIMITIINGYNVFSDRGISNYDVTVEKYITREKEDFEVKLRKLNKLKNDGVITNSEFQKEKEKIFNREM